MMKFSGGYVAINPNIVISDIEQNNKSKIPSIQEGIFAVLENILLRGVPTKPSAHLIKKVGTPEKTEEKEEKEEKGAYWYAVGDRLPCWDRVIKGWINEEGKEINPAREYYKNLQEISKTASQLFLPECPFNQIVLQSTASDLSARDFYSPFYNVNIEMDGAQHENADQETKDKENDKTLKDIVKITRIKPSRLETLDKKKLKDWLENHLPEEIKPIDELKPFQRNYLYIFRLQLVFLQLFKHGQIPLEQGRFLVKLTTPEIENEFFPEVFDLALEDLSQWLENLFKLADLPFEMPQIELTKASNADFKIDIDPYSFYDQTIYESDGIIRVRNDYFPYDRAANTDGKKYAVSKNYYQVATAIEDGKVIFPFQNADANNPAHEEALTFLLKNLFGFPEFRPKQLEIVAAGLHPENGVIGILPTGSGKSVCYQLVSMLTPAVSLIISPLKVLMDDQTNNLSQKFISTAERIHSSSKIEGMALFQKRQAKLVYISPERFFNTEFTEAVANKPIGQVVLDEVHCLSEWGHEFRTAYLLLFPFLKETLWGNALLMGTTATASPFVVDDIINEFSKIKDKKDILVVTAQTVKRKELFFKAIKVGKDRDRDEVLEECLREIDGKSIVFTSSKPKTVKIAQWIEKQRIDNRVGFFNRDNAEIVTGASTSPSQISPEQKAENQEKVYRAFLKGEIQTLVATNAFGMGVDIPDIRKTIHYQMPGSVESLYQEMGRAGRDGENSICTVLLLEYSDTKANIERAFKRYDGQLDLLEFLAEIDDIAYGSLKSPVHFMRQNGIESYKHIESVYCKLKDDPKKAEWVPKDFDDIWKQEDAESEFERNNVREKLEKSLYKLYVLGLINLWQVVYSSGTSPSYLNLSANELTGEQICKNLVLHIQRYDYQYQYNGPQTLKDCLAALCKWDEENYLKYRWESLKTLYNMLSALAESKDSGEFATQIDQFFSTNKWLQEAIDGKTDVSKWFKFLNATDSHLAKNQIARQMEQRYTYSFLNLASALVAIKNKDFEMEQNRLRYAFSRFEADETVSLNEILKESLCYLKNKPKDIETFLYFLADEFPEMLDYNSVRENAPQKHLENARKRAGKNKLLKSLEKLKSVMNETIGERKKK